MLETESEFDNDVVRVYDDVRDAVVVGVPLVRDGVTSTDPVATPEMVPMLMVMVDVFDHDVSSVSD